MKFGLKFVAASVALVCATGAMAQKGETVKMVRIDPLTGLLGPVSASSRVTSSSLKSSAAPATPQG
jgi:branched-chain amino acid transport system substrate-binding protein